MVTRTATIQIPRVCHVHHRGTKNSLDCLARDYGLPRQECSVDPGLGLCRSPPREATTPTSRCDISSVHKNLRVNPGQFSGHHTQLDTEISKPSPELYSTYAGTQKQKHSACFGYTIFPVRQCLKHLTKTNRPRRGAGNERDSPLIAQDPFWKHLTYGAGCTIMVLGTTIVGICPSLWTTSKVRRRPYCGPLTLRLGPVFFALFPDV